MNMPVVRRGVRLVNSQGLHLRPADMFVRLANTFSSEIKITKENQTVDGKSILGIVMLAAEYGSHLELEATGDDAESAVNALIGLIEQGFAEGQLNSD